jgi:ribosomal protein S11
LVHTERDGESIAAHTRTLRAAGWRVTKLRDVAKFNNTGLRWPDVEH